ncbi:MAG: mercury(II) reductase [Acidimicrobiia bacterium]|nr:MAG: mercury(II) reductase [Acidimicrobiia bacterium]
MSTKITLDVTGMTCDGCEGHVGDALAAAGLTDLEVDWRRGFAAGTDAGSFDVTKATEALEGSNYEIVSVSRPQDVSTTSVDDGDSDYDLLILGSGSAAFAAAIKARDLGATVAIVEKGTIGGTCVNIGCVPSKALLRPAELFHQAGHSPFAGVETSAGDVDLAALIAAKDELVGILRQEKYANLLDVYGIDLIQGTAKFTGPTSVEVDGRTVTAGRYLISTGASSWVPPIEGLDETGYLTSTTALELTELPEELIVVGANAIGLELGQLFAHLGSKVTWVEALDRIAPFEEPEISGLMRGHLIDEGSRIYEGALAKRAGKDGNRVWLEIESGDTTTRVEADQLLMATGRRANTASLGLDLAGVETDPRGAVIVDAGLATSNPSVWAAGDVTTTPQFVYVAAAAGNIAAENALRDAGRTIDFRTMPRVTFTTPSIASVGLTEEAAREAGLPVMTSILPLESVPRALVNRDTVGAVKLVADESTGELLGAHVLAEGAGDVIQAAVVAMNYHATVDEIAAMFHPYLTMAEALKLAAQTFNKDVKNLSCCAA